MSRRAEAGIRQKFQHDFGNYIQQERDRNGNTGNAMYPPRNKRFCEGCRTYVHRDRVKTFKGWNCKECRDAKART